MPELILVCLPDYQLAIGFLTVMVMSGVLGGLVLWIATLKGKRA